MEPPVQVRAPLAPPSSCRTQQHLKALGGRRGPVSRLLVSLLAAGRWVQQRQRGRRKEKKPYDAWVSATYVLFRLYTPVYADW